MKKILVPTDFSDTSKNAAEYAMQLAANVPGASITLYHVYAGLTAGVDGSVMTETPEDRATVLGLAFSNFEAELKTLGSVPIQSVYEEGSSLVSSVDRYVRANRIDLVIMGITGVTKMEQALMGSNAVNMAREGICPVIIVPPLAKYVPIKNILLATDFKNVKDTVPVAVINSLLSNFKPILHIVYAGDQSIVEKDDFETEKAWLEKSFAGYDPDFYFIRTEDFLDAISSFTADHHIELIVTVPKDRTFLESLFKTSHTKKLAYHSHVPILAIRE